ncbi:MAG: AAA family ATPase [Planctomycetota bacterium]
MLIHEITLRNMLSFGPDTPPLPMRNLNVLIGPNGSGKSNLIEAIGLLRAAPRHLATAVREGGGIHDWIWRGKPKATASLDVVVDQPQKTQPLRHVIQFRESAQRFELVGERIEDAEPTPRQSDSFHPYYKFEDGRAVLKSQCLGSPTKQEKLQPDELDESILSRRRDPTAYPQVTWLGWIYERIRLYREWSFGPHTALRQPQKADQPNDMLEADALNLGLVLNRLEGQRKAKRHLLENLRELYDSIDDYHIQVEGGTVQVFLHESDFPIPATRLSDGTMRYLCLLAILCNPELPPLVCIEEPELGLHPDVLPTIAKLLKEASAKQQIIVTTHSDILVDALTETPESIVVCEKHEGQTVMRRLEAEKLAKWLEKYRLGNLWTSGEIGGLRW